MLKFIHRWFSVVAAFFILMFAISGIVLNHRHFFSPVSVDRNRLPGDYRFNNWNLAAIKGSTPLSTDSMLVYGNIGVWLTDSAFSGFEPFNDGFSKGIDNRKTFHVFHSPAGNTYAGTLSGLYYLEEQQWIPLALPVKEKQVRAIEMRGDSLLVLTRSSLILGADNPALPAFTEHRLPHPKGYAGRTSVFRALWVLHSGEIFGFAGKIIVDFMGLVMIFLTLTGIIWFIAPDVMKSLKTRLKARKNFGRLNRFSRKWHNLIGITMVFFLAINTIAGSFLRPPLLIAIAKNDIANIKGTILDHVNPWYDKLRDIRYDGASDRFLLSSSDGFFAVSPALADSLEPIGNQPPVSVMGINVFEPQGEGQFIIGSFSGIFNWDPSHEIITDMITGLPPEAGKPLSSPFGSLPVAGYISTPNGKEFIFDYDAGVFSKSQGMQFPEMPESVKRETPFPLWNLALEVHTGRIYSTIFGKFYILFIPLAGIMVLSILLSGMVLWIRDYRRKKRIRKHCQPPSV
ncbi:MAG: PepSY domain-containing protein [Bacteroidales bacterium]|jgi:hypothetical protein|nr:PepSY domain-containing protein [Bacteroidales bacterium]NLM93043.1 PepSY domain-containing protein [Bacteroidales bacterium]